MSRYGEHDLPPARREEADISFRAAALGLGATLLTLAGLAGACILLFGPAMRDQATMLPLPVLPAPRLQARPDMDMARDRQRDLAALNGLYWVDRGAGLVHQPIDAAMARLARQGIGDWPAPPPGGR
ncbi:hypothetical protein AAC691_06600 [Nguyenibacter vanlangensis]|uniref:Uncharacterized protein n=1 Tax=Nguyenibacter vanlangensis TaxID=1216886 RepID=A0ABZ3D8Y4_9PROT